MHSLRKKSIGIIFGPNGAGKGTLARHIADKFSYKHINTGALLRLKSFEPGNEHMKELLDEGEMLDDQIVEGILVRHFKSYDVERSKHVVLEGIPRRKNQIKTIARICNELNYEIRWIISLEIPLEVIIDRVKDRVLAPDGNVYHLIYNPPPKYFKKEDFSKRLDDRPQIIEKRYANYVLNTKECISDPLFEDVPKFAVDATKPIEEIYGLVDGVLGQMQSVK